MAIKQTERLKAIKLRQNGYSYSEILQHVKVSKSTLSLWLGDIKLNKTAKELLNNKRVMAQKSGAEAKRNQRINKTKKIEQEAIKDIRKITDEELFLMGIMLYWAEGSKQRQAVSQRVEFSNADPRMCKLFLRWLTQSLNVPRSDIVVCIYIHESKSDKKAKALKYWSKQINFPGEKFGRTCLTKTVYPRRNKRKNLDNYYGQLRIKVKKSTDLNRKIMGWVKGICIESGVNKLNSV